jgi:hypothetical protein
MRVWNTEIMNLLSLPKYRRADLIIVFYLLINWLPLTYIRSLFYGRFVSFNQSCIHYFCFITPLQSNRMILGQAFNETDFYYVCVFWCRLIYREAFVCNYWQKFDMWKMWFIFYQYIYFNKFQKNILLDNIKFDSLRKDLVSSTFCEENESDIMSIQV